MKIVNRWSIRSKSDCIFVKVELKNFFKHNSVEDVEFYLFALMELTTNIIKYAKEGEIFLLGIKDSFAIASLDRGQGIEDLELAQQKSFTTASNSLGLGLFQIRQNSKFSVEIFTSTQEKESGTVVLVRPKNTDKNIVSFTKPYMWSNNNGDYFTQKGRFVLFGDASGHGLKARKSADYIKNNFMNSIISCIQIDKFYEDTHNYIKQNNLRSSVISIFEINSNKITMCGMGNFGCWIEEYNGYKYFTLKNGIIGEVLRKADTKEFELVHKQKLIIATDGNDPKRMNEFLKKIPKELSSIMMALCIEHFVSQELDDSSVLILQYKKED